MRKMHAMSSMTTIGILLTVPLLLASCAGPATTASWGHALIKERALGSEKRLSLCGFRLVNAGNGTAHIATLDKMGSVTRITNYTMHTDYPDQLATGFIESYEHDLKGAGAFQYLPMPVPKHLVPTGAKSVSTEPMGPVDKALSDNHLDACVEAVSVLKPDFGWIMKVAVATTWVVTGQSGWKLTIETYAISKEAHGKEPHMDDPKLRPVFLELANESVKQFLAEFANQGMLPTVSTTAP
jgi:hypothetical protein